MAENDESLIFANWMAEIIRFEVEETEDEFVFSRSSQDIKLALDKSKLCLEIKELRKYKAISETILATDKSYEILVKEEGSYFRFSLFNRNSDSVLELDDEENGLTYVLGRPSNAFALYLIEKAAAMGEPRALSRPTVNASTIRRAVEDEPCILNFVKKFIAGRLTLKITSKFKKTANEYEKYSSAFLFNISYNTDRAFVQQRDFDELLRTGRITRTRRSNIDEIDPPRRTYIPDLIHHYQLAVGTENPMLEYISYYHIIEYFFENVFNEDLVEKVRSKITHPDFSYKRKKDISSLIKDIGKSIKMRDESMIFNEQEGLRLTLKKYVDLGDLILKLNSYDSNLLDYYKQNFLAVAK